MALVRMEIHTLVVGGGPIASLLVLRSRESQGETPRQLPIKIGMYEASAISMGVAEPVGERPMTHDLMQNLLQAFDSTMEGVCIVDVHNTTFYAQLMLRTAGGHDLRIDCRPSDGIALAVRMDAPIYAEESVLDTASVPDFQGVAQREQDLEMERFHDFVESLSPEDFS